MADRMLVVEVDSTVELPSKPDPGSAGSSSLLCQGVSNFSSEHEGPSVLCVVSVLLLNE